MANGPSQEPIRTPASWVNPNSFGSGEELFLAGARSARTSDNARLIELTGEDALRRIEFGVQKVTVPVALDSAYSQNVVAPIEQRIGIVADWLLRSQLVQHRRSAKGNPLSDLVRELRDSKDPALTIARELRESLSGQASRAYSDSCAYEALVAHRHRLLEVGVAPEIDFITRKMMKATSSMRDWEKRLYTTSGGSRNDRDISVVPLNNHFSGAGAMIVHPKEEALLGILGSELALNARGTPAVFCTNKIAAARLKEVIRQSALDNKGDIKVLTLNDAKKLKPGVPDKLEVGPLIIYSLDQESHGGVHRSSLAPFERQRILTPQVIHLQLEGTQPQFADVDGVLRNFRESLCIVEVKAARTGNLFPDLQDERNPWDFEH